MADSIVYRVMSLADRPFVTKSWLDTAAESPQWRHVPARLFFPRHRFVVETILARSPALIACSADSPETILGFVVAENDVLHYVHVKARFRHFGICRGLLEQIRLDPAACTYTHFTADARRHLLTSKRASFDPYLLFGAAHLSTAMSGGPVNGEHEQPTPGPVQG